MNSHKMREIWIGRLFFMLRIQKLKFPLLFHEDF
jgi:hypothetical protein